MSSPIGCVVASLGARAAQYMTPEPIYVTCPIGPIAGPLIAAAGSDMS